MLRRKKINRPEAALLRGSLLSDTLLCVSKRARVAGFLAPGRRPDYC
ncbi:hypothetical protein [uncultured Zoogloea sp.]|jgi:hypothetical protein|nr:hypothetical protein [uncultured Zoogloea sp.]